MKYLSVCSGIEAASVAWHPLGWEPVAFSEIEAFPSAVLAHHYPSVPNWGDMTKFEEWPDVASLDVLVGGTPCQSFSVAGLRAGLADPRGNLMLTFGAIARRYRPRWVVWENVPGVLSSGGGRDFGTFLGMLGELGYGFAYRVLDAQYFGVAQRRRRVFVVGYLGAWQPAAAVLFESASLRGDSPPRREPRERVAGTLANRARGGGGLGTDFDCSSSIPVIGGGVAHSLRGDGFDASEDGTGRGTPLVPHIAGTMKANNGGGGFSNSIDHAAAGYMIPYAPEVSPALKARDYKGPSSDGDGDGDGDGAPLVMAPAFSRRPQQQIATRQDGISYAHTAGEPARVLAPAVYRKSRRAQDAQDAQDAETWVPGEVANTMNAFDQGDIRATEVVLEPIAFNARQDPDCGEVTHPLDTDGHSIGLAFNLRGREGGAMPEVDADGLVNMRAASGGSSRSYVVPSMAVRRLTPTECERLQGFPDGWTQVPYRNKPAPDGPRYKALGNSMAVPCMIWIGKRIAAVQEVLNGKNA